MAGTRRWSFDNLPLFYKVLVPFAALLLAVGAFGAFLLVRNEATRGQNLLSRELQEASLQARGALQAQELSLLETANLAANLQGMPEALRDRDAPAIEQLLRTVFALKTDVDWVTIVLADGSVWSTLGAGGRPAVPLVDGTAPFVSAVLSSPGTMKQPGFVRSEQAAYLAIAAPICLDRTQCTALGATVVGRNLATTVQQAVTEAVVLNDAAADQPGAVATPGVRLFDGDQRLLASIGATPDGPAGVTSGEGRLVRVSEQLAGEPQQTLYAPLQFGGQHQGHVAVSLPAGPVLDAVKQTGRSLTIVLLLCLAGIVGVGALVSRRILRQVKPLVAANEALGAGDLSARVEVTSGDEIGALAEGLNAMAARLQATYDTLEMRVQERTQQVEELLDDRTQFFASLSHELRTPLAIVMNQSDILLMNVDEDRARMIRPIRQSAAQLLGTVNEILDLARAEAGTLEVVPMRLDVGSFFSDLQPMIDGLAFAGSLTIDVDIAPGLPLLPADPRRLREIVVNLVDNAVKYTPEGGQVTVTVDADPLTDEIMMTVADTGVGIAEHVGDKIFKPFHRIEAASPRPGHSSSGLGLALVQRLVKAHDGEISYRSQINRGTSFVIRMPAAPPQATPPPPPGHPAASPRAPEGETVIIGEGRLLRSRGSHPRADRP